jgi:L,D-peptidoglycan transpeptidase YkuD (ErfK/YbiS/YcfS/YnhG family)
MDRLARPLTQVPTRRIRADQGWCDDSASPCYNRLVRRPFAASHEELWRADGLYDVVGVLDYNRRPIRRSDGSAIFLHIAAPGYAPTAGCVAVTRQDLLRLLRRMGPQTKLIIR